MRNQVSLFSFLMALLAPTFGGAWDASRLPEPPSTRRPAPLSTGRSSPSRSPRSSLSTGPNRGSAPTPKKPWLPRWAALDVALSTSVSRPTVYTHTPSPMLIATGLGFRPCYRTSIAWGEDFKVPLCLGLDAEYRFIGQYSAVSDDVGNMRGHRFSWLSPSVTVYFPPEWQLHFNLQIGGDYVLSTPTDEAEQWSYGKGLGFKLEAMHRIDSYVKKAKFGLGIEYLKFGTRTISHVDTRDLTEPLKLLQIGVTVSYELF